MQGLGLENVDKSCTRDDETRGIQAGHEAHNVVTLKEQRREIRLLDLVSPCSSGASFPFLLVRNILAITLNLANLTPCKVGV